MAHPRPCVAAATFCQSGPHLTYLAPVTPPAPSHLPTSILQSDSHHQFLSILLPFSRMSPRPPSKLDDRSCELSPTPARTKEENQERAFTAASRRKDRTLDARVESANRASMLHKKRTGRALKITRAIVAAERMYEEIDENYDAKILRYKRVQDAQINSDFDNSLLAGLTGASHSLQMPTLSHSLQLPCSSPGQMSSPQYSLQTPESLSAHMPSSQGPSGPEADQRRASTFMPNRPANARHLSLSNLSQLSISSGPKSDPLPGAPNFNVIPTPNVGFSPSYTGPISSQVPDGLVQGVAPNSMRLHQQQLMQNCHGFGPSASDSPYLGGLPISTGQLPIGQYRNRIASAPDISFHQPQVHSRGHSQAATPAPGSAASDGATHQHHRVRSEPGPIPTPIPTDTIVSSLPGEPKRTNSSSTASLSTTDLLRTPRTTPPHTPTIKSSCQVSHSDMNLNLNSALDLNYVYNFNISDSGNASPPTHFKYSPTEMQDVDLHVDLQISPTTMTDEEFDDFRQFASGLDGNSHFLPGFDPSLNAGSGSLDFGFNMDVGFANGAEVC
ncbi:hypothetical protein BDV06DRAFT_204857 [Aspergillus oleicola]